DAARGTPAALARLAAAGAPSGAFPPPAAAGGRPPAGARLPPQQRISRHIFRGYLANWRRDLQSGTREYRKALKLDPQDDGVKFALGVGSVHQRLALTRLERDPRDTKALGKLGYIAWSTGEYDEAIRRFQQVLAIDPENAAAFVHLGVSHAAQERFDASIAAYRDAERLKPDLSRLVAQSIELVEQLRAVKEHWSDPSAHARLGEIYAGDGRFDRAIDCFETVVTLEPDRPQGFFTLARYYEAEERDALALGAYGRGLALDPANGPARNNYEKLAIKIALARGTPTVVALGRDQTVAIDPDAA